MSLASFAIAVLQVISIVGLGYYYLLLIAGSRRPELSPAEPRSDLTIAIAIPAHNEATVLAETLRALNAQQYPPELFDIYVAADHCSDDTAEIARAGGAICYERSDLPRGRKAYALQWLLKQILDSGQPYDAVVIFDADSRVDGQFLQAMAGVLTPERPVLQGQHLIAVPEQNRFSGLAAVDMRLANLLRNRAKQNLGLSARLMGDAMGFSTDLLRRYGWLAGSLVEDREYGLYLLTQGIRTHYVAGAKSWGQAAPSWQAASTQRVRWYSGVFQLQQKFTLPLLRQGLVKRDRAALDQAIELLLPPLSILALLSVGLVLIHLLWPALPLLLPLPVSIATLLAWFLLPFFGLWLDGAPRPLYRALLYVPVYLLWRLGCGLQARLRPGRVQWVRTRRQEEIKVHPPKV